MLNKVGENITYRKNIISMHKSGKGSISRKEKELLEMNKKAYNPIKKNKDYDRPFPQEEIWNAEK